MKILFTLVALFYLNIIFTQNSLFDSLMVVGKAEFSTENLKPDYKLAVKAFEQAVKIEPNNTEAHYFLGYAYSLVDGKDETLAFMGRTCCTLHAS